MILKQVIRYENGPAIEATWVENITLPQQESSPGVSDLVLRTQEVVVKCRAYGATQMDELRADLGADAPQYEEMIQQCIADYVPPPLPSHTPEQIKEAVVASTQQRLDDFAKTRNYDGILSACTYATSSVEKFQAEGQYCVAVRDATWAALYALLDDVESGERPMPAGFDDVVGALPALEWPQ